MPEQKQNMTGCEKFEPLLEDYLSGELPRLDAERLAIHLDDCRGCREALEDARLSARLVAIFEPAAEPGAAFTRGVMAHIHAAESWMQQQRNFWRPLEALAWRLAFSASLALAVLFAYGVRTTRPAAPAAAPAVLVPQTDVFAPPVSAPPSNSDEVLMAIAERYNERQ